MDVWLGMASMALGLMPRHSLDNVFLLRHQRSCIGWKSCLFHGYLPLFHLDRSPNKSNDVGRSYRWSLVLHYTGVGTTLVASSLGRCFESNILLVWSCLRFIGDICFL